MNRKIERQAFKLAGSPRRFIDTRPAYMAFKFDETGVTSKAWIWECEGRPEAPRFDGYVDLDTGWVCDLSKFK